MSFNLKQSQQEPPTMENVLGIDPMAIPSGVDPMAAMFLWNNFYKDDPSVGTISEMVQRLGGPDGVKEQYNLVGNPEKMEDIPQKAENLQETGNIAKEVFMKSQQSIKDSQKDIVMNRPFNMKKISQESMPPLDPMGLNDSPEMIGDPLEEQQNINNIPQPPFKTFDDFKKWADNTPMEQVLQSVAGKDADHLKERMESYYTAEDEGDKAVIIASVFDDPSFPLKDQEGIIFEGRKEHFGNINIIIKKIAKKITSTNKRPSLPFNLKTAQHKTQENVIMWGPSETRKVDPFLRQPVSDWHIIERNKGFGLVVDDIWNIDYETIWRQNIMDKYSRPYRDDEGNWVGGYIQKRFEVDKHIPETNNIQLKPDQIRKPILPEYGNIESRLQEARSRGKIEGAVNETKPFNWKEAKKKS